MDVDLGHLLNFKVNHQIEIIGFDPFINSKKKFIINNLNNLNIKFDVILLMHTLEHFENFNLEISKIYKLLNKDGIIIFEVPTLNCLEFKYFKKFYFHLDLPRHLNFFDKENIKILFKNKFKEININNGYSFILAPLSPFKSINFDEKASIIRKIISYILFLPFLLSNFFKFKNGYFAGVYRKI